MSERTTVICVDCSFLGYQAVRTMGDLEVDDVPTGVLYNFLTRVLNIGTLYGTNNFVFAFDSPTETGVRRAASPGYKLKRQKDREKEDADARAKRAAMRQQLDVLREAILPALGFTNVFCVERFEADDIIGATVGIDFDWHEGPGAGTSLVKRGQPLSTGWDKETRFIIVSADEDLWQLLGKDGRVSMYNPTTKVEYGYADFVSEWGIVPVQWSSVKAIAGCESDNIDGVKGVGPKTAIKFLKNQLVPPAPKLYAIRDFDAQRVKNYYLTRLPHEDFPVNTINLRPPAFAGKAGAFKALCERYAFATFLAEPMFSRWKAFFKGEIVKGKEPLGKLPLGRVDLKKQVVSTVKMARKMTVSTKAPASDGFGF